MDRAYQSGVIKVMQQHRSIRNYTEEGISEEVLQEIVKAGQGAASSHFVQAYSIVHVKDQNKKSKIAELANNQKHINDSAVFLIFCGDFKRLEYAVRKNDGNIHHDSVENLIVSIVDTSLVAQNILTAAESLGYGGCYIGGIRNNPGPISEIIDLPDKVIPLFGMTLGVPKMDQEVKPRLPMEAIIHIDKYNEEKYDSLIDTFDQQMEEYYKKRSTNQKKVNWSKSMTSFLSSIRRPHMKEFLAKKGFHLK